MIKKNNKIYNVFTLLALIIVIYIMFIYFFVYNINIGGKFILHERTGEMFSETFINKDKNKENNVWIRSDGDIHFEFKTGYWKQYKDGLICLKYKEIYDVNNENEKWSCRYIIKVGKYFYIKDIESLNMKRIVIKDIKNKL